MAGILSMRNWYDTGINILFELRNTAHTATSLKAKIYLVYPNSIIEKHYGYTDAGNNFLFCPNLMRLWLSPKPYYVEGIKTFYVSSDNEYVLDLIALSKVPNAVSQEALIQWKYLRTWEELKVKDVKGTINLQLYDHEYANNFTTSSFSVISTKALEFLSETPRKVLFLAMLLSAFIGGGILSLVYLVLTIILVLIAHFL
jgi:hypothetical protein